MATSEHRFRMCYGTDLPCDASADLPKNRAADVIVAAGMTESGWVPVDPYMLQTRYAGVFAVEDLANAGEPRVGVYAEGTARMVATNLISLLWREAQTDCNPGGLLH